MGSPGAPSIQGSFLWPDDPGWDQARGAWNLAVEQRPAAVALAQGAGDVAAVIAFASANGLRVAAQGTGHGAGTLGELHDTVLIKTERMRGIELDRQRAIARIEAGVLAAELGAAAQQAGLCALPGSSPDVGVVGFTLGGGLGWLGRRYGFACNRVRAIELVGADGEPRTIDAEHEPELFWALRGGGGGFAIVTALQIELVAVAEVYAGTLILPAEVGVEAIRRYRDWAAGVDRDVTSIVRFLRLPPLPEIPEPIRDRPLLTIGAACIADRERGERLIAPLRELGEPIMDSFGQIPGEGLSRIHMDPEHPVPGIGDHALIAELPDQAIEAFAGAVGPQAGSALLLGELRQLGGALGEAGERAGALDKLDGAFLLSAIGSPASPETGETIEADLARVHGAMQPWEAPGGYLNFAERPCDLDAILPAEVCHRLREVKHRWDPHGLIRSNHSLAIGPAA